MTDGGDMAAGPSAGGAARLLRSLPAGAVAPLLPADFYGLWDVRRRIVDRLSGAIHHFSGKALISASAFDETGEVDYGTVSLKAARRYILSGRESGLAIAFADGRLFVELEAQAAQNVHHLCGADDYRGKFFFRDIDCWAEHWHVIGPRKHYVSLAHYRRSEG